MWLTWSWLLGVRDDSKQTCRLNGVVVSFRDQLRAKIWRKGAIVVPWSSPLWVFQFQNLQGWVHSPFPSCCALTVWLFLFSQASVVGPEKASEEVLLKTDRLGRVIINSSSLRSSRSTASNTLSSHTTLKKRDLGCNVVPNPTLQGWTMSSFWWRCRVVVPIWFLTCSVNAWLLVHDVLGLGYFPLQEQMRIKDVLWSQLGQFRRARWNIIKIEVATAMRAILQWGILCG